MIASKMARETRIGLAAFAMLSLAVVVNLVFLQGRRAGSTVETAAIVVPRPQADSGQAEANLTSRQPAAPGVEGGESSATAEPAPARPLPVATAPAASLNRVDVVRAIQRGLGAQGYEPGQPDGLLGLMTRAAIMAYEADSGLALTAEPGEELMRRIELGANAPPVGQRKGPPEVKTVDAATLIRSVGQWLAALGYPVGKGETAMSAALVRAIRDYEASQKMPETGRISAPLVARLSRAGQGRSAAR